MQDAADFELQKEPQAPPPPARRPPSFTPLIVGALVVAAAAAVFLYLRRDEAPAASTKGSLSTESTVTPPAKPLGVEVAPIDLPPLDGSDELVRRLVRALSSHPRVAAWLTTDGLIRNFTVVVENIAAGRTPSRHLRVLKPAAPFAIVEARGGQIVIDPRSYNRYDEIAAAVASVDPGGAASLYSMLKPRIEEAYRELGSTGSFDRALETALVTLLEAPAVGGEITLVPRGAVYNFNDPRIERLTQAQKQLVRMGARNVGIIQRRLREIALALGIPAERLPPR
jgi:hypothetical protein